VVTLFQRLKHVDSLWHKRHWQLFLLSHQLVSMQKKMDKIASLKLQKLDWVHLQQWPLLWLLLCFIILEWLIFHPCLKMRTCRCWYGAYYCPNCSLYCTRESWKWFWCQFCSLWQSPLCPLFTRYSFFCSGPSPSLPPSLFVLLMIGFMVSFER